MRNRGIATGNHFQRKTEQSSVRVRERNESKPNGGSDRARNENLLPKTLLSTQSCGGEWTGAKW